MERRWAVMTDILIVLVFGFMTIKRIHKSNKVMAKECKRVTINGEEEVRRWIDLPIEIGALIAARLHLIEFHVFRSICNQWRLAASLNSSSLPQSFKPWILFYGEDKCFLYNLESPKSYLMQIPELKGADCIASEGGWLLVHLDRHLFFFNIFSRAKIYLPEIPGFKLSGHVATFSSPPTSKDCIVFVVVNHITTPTRTIEINMCRRGSRDWETNTYPSDLSFEPITIVKYRAKDKLLCYFYFKFWVMETYNPCSKSRNHHMLLPATSPEEASLKILVGYLNYVISHNIDISEWLDRFVEEKKIWISLCGTSLLAPKGDIFYPHEVLDYSFF
ncbi:F-box protein At1g49360-like [Tasmannia lanceolata]|uniref:F-box protein At1g49360-like n=1 Tax=Tasmannia lanceolata TaxID=3420 RepID=UPI004062E4FE